MQEKMKNALSWLLVLLVFLVVLVAFWLTNSANGAELKSIKSIEAVPFEMLEPFFKSLKPNDKNDQIYTATWLLIKELRKGKAGKFQEVADSIKCKGISPDQWQDIVGVALQYRTYQIVGSSDNKQDEVLTEMKQLAESLKSFSEIINRKDTENSRLNLTLKDKDVQITRLEEDNEKLMTALRASNESLEKQILPCINALEEENVKQKQEIAALKARPMGVLQAEVDQLKADYERQIVDLKAEIERLTPKEPAKQTEPAYVEPKECKDKPIELIFSVGGVGFAGSEKFDIAKWLDDKESHLRYQSGGEAGLGIEVKKILFAQAYYGLSGENSDKHFGADAGVCLKGFKIGGGVINFGEKSYPIIYASSDNLLAPFIRVCPEKDARFVQFGLNANIDILSHVERMR